MTRPIAQKYCEGKVKSILKRRLKELEIVKRETHKAFDWDVVAPAVSGCVFTFVGP
jgi:hypothetical protein